MNVCILNHVEFGRQKTEHAHRLSFG